MRNNGAAWTKFPITHTHTHRERERQRERETERERDRERERQTDRDTHTHTRTHVLRGAQLYLSNYRSVLLWEVQDNFDNLFKPVDRSRWSMVSSSVPVSVSGRACEGLRLFVMQLLLAPW